MVRRRLRGSVWRCHLPEAAERAHCRPTRHVAEAGRAVLVLGIPRLPTTPASAQSDNSMASPVASSMMTPTVSDTSPMRPKANSSMVTRMKPPVPQRMPATLAAGDCPWSQTVCVIWTSRWGGGQVEVPYSRGYMVELPGWTWEALPQNMRSRAVTCQGTSRQRPPIARQEPKINRLVMTGINRIPRAMTT